MCYLLALCLVRGRPVAEALCPVVSDLCRHMHVLMVACHVKPHPEAACTGSVANSSAHTHDIRLSQTQRILNKKTLFGVQLHIFNLIMFLVVETFSNDYWVQY